jgi:hypothetical protein
LDFFPFWYVLARKIWQPWRRRSRLESLRVKGYEKLWLFQDIEIDGLLRFNIADIFFGFLRKIIIPFFSFWSSCTAERKDKNVAFVFQ